MRRRGLIAAAVLLLEWQAPASAHQLDEYLQAAMFAVSRDHVEVELHLTPGVEVSRAVLPRIDTDGNGVVSPVEQRAYAEQVRRDLSLTMDDVPLSLRLQSSEFPEVQSMKEGLGEIVLVFAADVPRGGPDRKLVFQNHHQRGISSYLENAFVPRDRSLRITGQERSADQSSYRLDYTDGGLRPRPLSFASWSELRATLLWASLALSSSLALARSRKRSRKANEATL